MQDLIVPVTPVKPIKVYSRRKSQIIRVFVTIPQEIKDIELKQSDQSEISQDDSQSVPIWKEEEKKTSKEKLEEKCYESEIPQSKKNSKVAPEKQRFHRPRIMEEGRTPRNPATTRIKTISKKRKNNDKNTEEEVIPEPETPEKQSLPKRRKNEKVKKTVARVLVFDQEMSCVELSRSSGPNFPKGRRRTSTRRRSIWKRKSIRSKRKKIMVKWGGITLAPLVAKLLKDIEVSSQKDIEVSPQKDISLQIKDTTLMVSASNVASKRRNKKTDKFVEHLIQQISYQKEHGLSSLADVPLHIEDALVRSPSVAQNQPIKRTKDIAKLIKEMSRLKIKKRVTTLIKSNKKKNMELVTAKVDLDQETIKEWELLMVNDLPDRSYDDEETELKWKKEREIFQSRINLFINQMHLLQGNRKFKQWKGSVVDSIVGVFLTQNVSDYLSSNAFISVAAKFPVDATEGSESIAYSIDESIEVNDSVVDDKGPNNIGNHDDTSSDLISLSEGSTREVDELEKTAKRKNEKTGIVEDEQVDWKSIRRIHTKEGTRDEMHMDSVNWNAVRLSGQHVFANTIRKRGQFRILSGRIAKFLNNETQQNGNVDLEWLRYAPSDLVKRYLLEIEGIGLKSTECVRLLGLKHSAFPVDTNVGRIAVRLGWVPLEPLPDGVQMHQLYQYPSMDLIQKYLWPRLCKLPQETLYELHYQMITFGKVFCTKVIPNCNACPMKSECKYFASAYVSSKVLLQGPEEKTDESDGFKDEYTHDVDANMTSNIIVEEYDSPDCSDETNSYEPMVEFPASPTAEITELTDIEDTPWRIPYQSFDRIPYQSFDRIPEIGVDMNALRRNLGEALVESGKVLNSCDEEVSKALVVLTPENACIPINTPRKMTYYNRLRTEHVVYVLPDDHELLHDFERREYDDPSPYLLAIWQPGEASYSCNPPTKKCDSDGSNLCNIGTCSYCWSIREQSSNTFRGTILIPCRTAMRGSFPLNGTYFQTNEVFADHDTSLKPIIFPRELCEGLEKRALYCGSSVTSIFRFLDQDRIQLSFWTGFLCMRAFDRKQRSPQELVRRLHTQPDKRSKKHMNDFDD